MTDIELEPLPPQLRFRAFRVRAYTTARDPERWAWMREQMHYGRALGPWRRSYNQATGDAIAGVLIHARNHFIVIVSSRGKVREITERQFQRGRCEAWETLEHRDAVGVWG